MAYRSLGDVHPCWVYYLIVNNEARRIPLLRRAVLHIVEQV